LSPSFLIQSQTKSAVGFQKIILIFFIFFQIHSVYGCLNRIYQQTKGDVIESLSYSQAAVTDLVSRRYTQ